MFRRASSASSTTSSTCGDPLCSIGECQSHPEQTHDKQRDSRPGRLARPSARPVVFSNDSNEITRFQIHAFDWSTKLKTKCRTASNSFITLSVRQCSINMLSSPFFIFLLLLIPIITSTNCHSLNDLGNNPTSGSKEFTNEFAVEFHADSYPADHLNSCKSHLDKLADRLASKHGFVNEGQVSLDFY